MDAKVVSALERAKEMVQVIPANMQPERTAFLADLLIKAKKELASAYPVEGAEVVGLLQERVNLIEFLIANPEFEKKYSYLDISVLRWRNSQGLPSLVPFSLNDPLFSFKLSYNWLSVPQWTSMAGSHQQLPGRMAGLYGDILEKCRAEDAKPGDLFYVASGTHTMDVRLAARFHGAIPQDIREKIAAASVDFATPRTRLAELAECFHGAIPQNIRDSVDKIRRKPANKKASSSNIFLIAEVDKWDQYREIRTRARPKEAKMLADPLIVGYKHGCLWLIGYFDETPLEQFAVREFSI